MTPFFAGDYEKGVDHLTNAIAVCGQPQQLLQVLQQTLPPPVFQMLLTKLPTISQVRGKGLVMMGAREFNSLYSARLPLLNPSGSDCAVVTLARLLHGFPQMYNICLLFILSALADVSISET